MISFMDISATHLDAQRKKAKGGIFISMKKASGWIFAGLCSIKHGNVVIEV